MSDSEDSTVTYMEDEVFLVEKQPLPAASSPTADLPGYVQESDSEDGSPDYLADGAVYDGCRSEMSHLHHLVEAEITRHPCYTITVPPSLLFPDGHLSPLPQIPSPPLLVESPWHHHFPSNTTTLTIVLPLYQGLPLHSDVRKACLLPRKRLCFAFGPRYEVGESSSAPTARPDGDFRRDYCFIATLDDGFFEFHERDVGLLVFSGHLGRDVGGIDTDEIYGILDVAQTEILVGDQAGNMWFAQQSEEITELRGPQTVGVRHSSQRPSKFDEDNTNTVDITLESTGTR
ncbi:hypothetical protein Tco_0468171 [Tanacetum coccineum]